MGFLYPIRYNNLITQLNSIRKKHGLSTVSVNKLSSDAKVTEADINAILSQMTIRSRWLSATVDWRVTKGDIIRDDLDATMIEGILTEWEKFCCNNSPDNTAFFPSNKSPNFTSHNGAFFPSNKSPNNSDDSFYSGNDGDDGFCQDYDMYVGGAFFSDSSNSDNSSNYSGH